MGFLTIFTEMSWVAALLLALGVVFTIVEVFVPGFGFFGVSGLLSLVAGIVVRIVQGLDIAKSLMLILVVIGFLLIMGIIMIISAQYGVLGKTGLFETKSTFSSRYDKLPKELKRLIGRSGKAITTLNLGGKAKIRGKIYDVQSINSQIEVGQHVKVVEIKDNTIRVRKWFE